MITMTTSDTNGPAWTLEAVNKLKQLWREDVEVDVISQTLQRPEQAVRAKAAALKLPQRVKPH